MIHRSPGSRCMRLLVAVLCFMNGSFLSAQEKTFTQLPEIQTAVVKDAAPAPVEAKPVVANTNKINWSEGPAPLWIWGDSPAKNYFARATFNGSGKQVTLKTTADNACVIFVNGQKVAMSEEWSSAAEADITKHVKAGENEILAEIRNEGGIAAFVFKLVSVGEGGKTEYLVSDDKWQIAEKRDAKVWKAAKVIGKLGEGPWGNPIIAAAGSGVAGSSVPDHTFQVLPGFQVEKLFTVPKDKLGSWVCITFDNKGRLIASDQGNQGLCRITMPPLGSKEPVKVEHLDVKITSAQGMLYAFDALYLSVNGGPGSGLYRAKDTNGDDQFDEVVKLATFNGGGEHGPHALRLSPDGKSIVIACGNHTKTPEKIDASRIPTNWSEDHLLPRQWDANGHARGILAPGATEEPDVLLRRFLGRPLSYEAFFREMGIGVTTVP